MKYTTLSFENYIESLPDDRKEVMTTLRNTMAAHLPTGFSEVVNSFGLHFVVPISTYPDGYHCTPGEPLPFISVASQKNFIAIYHMGIYANPSLHDWFINEYPKHVKTKLDMGKSCIRLKTMTTIPFELIGELCEKMSPNDWIALYEKNYKK